jgi:hypothetical protein
MRKVILLSLLTFAICEVFGQSRTSKINSFDNTETVTYGFKYSIVFPINFIQKIDNKDTLEYLQGVQPVNKNEYVSGVNGNLSSIEFVLEDKSIITLPERYLKNSTIKFTSYVSLNSLYYNATFTFLIDDEIKSMLPKVRGIRPNYIDEGLRWNEKKMKSDFMTGEVYSYGLLDYLKLLELYGINKD